MKRILVIDDNEEFRKMLCEILKNEGYEMVAASDGKEGIDLYRADPTDLVITDLVMPSGGISTEYSNVTSDGFLS